MSLFNVKKKRKTTNRAGGLSYRQDARTELVSILLTSFAQEQYYRSAEQTFGEVADLVKRVDPAFAAKAAIYARKTYGMRSITQVLAAELAPYASGKAWAKDFYTRVINRPDDMLEILAYYWASSSRGVPNAMKKGFARAFDQFDGYQLAKYRAARKGVKLVDVVNLVRPVPTQANAQALQALVGGTLRNRATWEARLTEAGATATNEQDKAAKKAATWTDLIRQNRLGYFALLRNLRNIADQAPEILDAALAILTNPVRIRKSMVLPFRYFSAQKAIAGSSLPIDTKRKVEDAINRALETAIGNVPKFEGTTLVVLDDSGSMTWGNTRTGKTPIELGAIFAAMLYKSNQADLMRFSDFASYVNPYYADSALGIAGGLVKEAKAAGTNFYAIFQAARRAYDRIIILSDMQGWMGYQPPDEAFRAYRKKYQADPYVYSFDLQGYGSMQLKGDKVCMLAGLSEKVFDLMKVMETDRDALIKQIEAVDLT